MSKMAEMASEKRLLMPIDLTAVNAVNHNLHDFIACCNSLACIHRKEEQVSRMRQAIVFGTYFHHAHRRDCIKENAVPPICIDRQHHVA